MSARFEFAFPCRLREVRSSHLRTVRNTDIPFPVMDSTNKDCESRQQMPEEKRGRTPAREPYTCL